MKISSFKGAHKFPELAKIVSNKVPWTIDEMMGKGTPDITRTIAFSLRDNLEKGKEKRYGCSIENEMSHHPLHMRKWAYIVYRVLRRLGSVFTLVYPEVQKKKKDSWLELQFSLADNSKLNVVYLLNKS
ncbi:hypothetical protein Tco_0734589 [Tanacetum coccineum]